MPVVQVTNIRTYSGKLNKLRNIHAKGWGEARNIFITDEKVTIYFKRKIILLDSAVSSRVVTMFVFVL